MSNGVLLMKLRRFVVSTRISSVKSGYAGIAAEDGLKIHVDQI
jgi:hypothetical protein